MRSTSPWRRAPFRRLTVGWVATNLADSALYLALAVWVRQLTDSEAAGALVLLALTAPTLLAPIVGHVVDSVSRRTVLIVTNLAGAVLVLTLLLVRGVGDVWIIYAVTFGYGLASTITAAAQSGLLRDLLPDEELASANGTMSTIDNAMRLISPPLGTGLFVVFGPWPVVLLSATGFVVMAVMLCLVRMQESPAVLEDGREPWRRQVFAGFRVLMGEPTLRILTLVTAVAFAATGLLNATAFPYVEQGTGEGPWVLGPLQAIMGVGAVIGGASSAWLLRRIGEARLVTWGLFVLGVSVLVGLVMVASTFDEAWVRWAGMSLAQVLTGLSVPWIVVGVVTYRQRVTLPRQQGRTSAAFNAVVNVPQAVVLGAGIALLGIVDVRLLLLVGAVGILAAATWSAFANRARRGVRSPAPSDAR